MDRAGVRGSLERIRITPVGAAVVAVAVIVGLAAVNTGNNAVYLVEAVLLGLLVASGLVSRRNLTHLELAAEAPDEVFANRPSALAVRVVNRDRLFGRRLLTVAREPGDSEHLIPQLDAGGVHRGSLDLVFQRRGRHRIPALRIASIFPFGLFRKVMRHRVELEVLVFPELFAVSGEPLGGRSRSGEVAARRPGWGHELLTLRGFREGDDPRGIHWKQSARTGGLVFMERDHEEDRRLTIVLDNAVGPLDDAETERRFERLVSEAASGAAHHLERGYAVELLTRDGWVPFGSGRGQRWRILESLALLEALPETSAPLEAPRGEALRLGFRAAAGSAPA